MHSQNENKRTNRLIRDQAKSKRIQTVAQLYEIALKSIIVSGFL